MSYLTQNFGYISWIFVNSFQIIIQVFMSISLFVASLDSAGLSLIDCEFLLFSGVNFETSGLVLSLFSIKLHYVVVEVKLKLWLLTNP